MTGDDIGLHLKDCRACLMWSHAAIRALDLEEALRSRAFHTFLPAVCAPLSNSKRQGSSFTPRCPSVVYSVEY